MVVIDWNEKKTYLRTPSESKGEYSNLYFLYDLGKYKIKIIYGYANIL